MRLQPCLGCAVIRARFFDVLPVAYGVVHLPQMHQLVNDDVVADKLRHLNQSPVQRHCPTTRTGSPPRPLISHRDASNAALQRSRNELNAGRQFPSGQRPKMTFDGSADFRSRRLHTRAQRNHLGAQPGHHSAVDRCDPKRMAFAAEPDFGAFRPVLCRCLTRAQLLELSNDPRSVLPGEEARFREGAAPRNRDTGLTGAIEEKTVAFREQVAAKLN